jgi:spore coat protein CotH
MKKTTVLFSALFSLFQILTAQSNGDFFDVSNVHDVRINFIDKNWKDKLDSLRMINSDNMLVGKVTLDGKAYDNVGIAYAKNPTYMNAGRRNPWSIRLNYIDKKQNHGGHASFNISQALRDPSLVREVLGYEIARKYMPTPQSGFINLTVEGENRGVHVSIEAMDDAFLTKNFAYTEGAFFRCVPDTRNEIGVKGECEMVYGALKPQKDVRCMMMNYDMLSKNGWDDLIEFTQVLTNDPNNVYKILNIDRTLWFLAYNNVLVNLNSYNGQFSGNYYLYKEKNGQFNFMPTELNLIFGSIKNTDGRSDLDLNGLATLDPMLYLNSTDKPLISQLLKNQDFKKVYFAHIKQILADWFESGLYKTRAEAMQKMITPFFEQDKLPPYQSAEFKRSLNETVGTVTKIPGIVELMTLRAKYLKKHPDMLVVPPQISEITVSNRKKNSTQTITEFHVKVKVDRFPRRVRIFYRPVGSNSPFAEAQMYDDGNNHDAAAGDKIFGLAINPKGRYDAIEYYILAENAGAAVFEPANYVAERRKVTLAELNK